MLAALRRRRSARRRMAWSAACACIVAGLLGGFVFFRHPDPVAASRDLGTVVVLSGPPRQVLPDGSVVDLRDDAQIEVHFDDEWRRVTLRSGQAHFKVSADPRRPFVVTAGAVNFRAVGTAFSVQMDARAVDLLVTEGRVAVDQGHGLLVDAGGTVSCPPRATGSTPVVQTLEPAAIAEKTAWRVPRLQFDATPLSDVLPMFTEFGGVQITLADPELATLRLSGVLRADNTSVLLQILQNAYGLRASRQGDRVVLER